MARAQRVIWGLFIAAVGVVSFVVYRHYVLGMGGDGAFHWLKDGVRYQLLEPRALGVFLSLPILLFVLGRSLADLPWPQRVLSVLFRLVSGRLSDDELVQVVESEDMPHAMPEQGVRP